MTHAPEIGPFGKTLGYAIEAWEDGFVQLAMEVQPQHLNRSGVLHGGIVSTLIDTACGYTGTWCRKPGNVRWSVTLALTTQFVGQAGLGRLVAIGRRRGGGRKVYFSSAEVRNGDGTLIGFGDCTHRYRSGSEEPDGVPRD